MATVRYQRDLISPTLCRERPESDERGGVTPSTGGRKRCHQPRLFLSSQASSGRCLGSSLFSLWLCWVSCPGSELFNDSEKFRSHHFKPSGPRQVCGAASPSDVPLHAQVPKLSQVQESHPSQAEGARPWLCSPIQPSRLWNFQSRAEMTTRGD